MRISRCHKIRKTTTLYSYTITAVHQKELLFPHWKKNAVTVTARLEKSCGYIVVLRKYQQRAYLSLSQSRAEQGKKIESCLGRKMVGRGLSVPLAGMQESTAKLGKLSGVEYRLNHSILATASAKAAPFSPPSFKFPLPC